MFALQQIHSIGTFTSHSTSPPPILAYKPLVLRSKMSESSTPEPSAFVAHPLCPPHLRKVGEDAVDAFDSAWLLPPQPGEGFDTAKGCFHRLQGCALSRCFAVATSTSKKTRAQVACVHHGNRTKDWRGLEVQL
jgi:hypothetical protein